jgi:hypothetical protein
MRQKKWRAVIVGVFLIVAALVFFLYMLSSASHSTDPAALMQTVGAVSGVVAGLALALIVIGLIGKKV